MFEYAIPKIKGLYSSLTKNYRFLDNRELNCTKTKYTPVYVSKLSIYSVSHCLALIKYDINFS